MPRAIKNEQHFATTRRRLTHARKRLIAGQLPRFRALSPTPPADRFPRGYRVHPTPTGQNAHSESATRVTPPKKNEFEKQTHLKVTLECKA